MSRKRCHRKVWNLTDPVTLAITGAAITDTARLDKLRLLELSALEAFKSGSPSVDDWRTMADVINIAETMARDGIGPEVLAVCLRAQEVLSEGFRRYKLHSNIGRAAGEYEALAEVYGYHDLQRSSVSRSVYESAIRKTGNRIRSANPTVKVMI